MNRTIEQFVNQHEVVLYGLLVELAKVAPPQHDQSIEKLKHQRRIGIALGHRDQVDVLVFDMAKGGRAECQDRGADLRVGDDLDAKDVGETWAAVAAESTEDEILTLLVED